MNSFHLYSHVLPFELTQLRIFVEFVFSSGNFQDGMQADGLLPLPMAITYIDFSIASLRFKVLKNQNSAK